MSSGPACFLYGILALGAVIMGIVLWACSVKTVDSQENAIAYDAVWCKLQARISAPIDTACRSIGAPL
jgi:hypothetical protein